MFFIGVFGIQGEQKKIGTYNNAVCSNCGALTRLELYKDYSYLHIFFIPTFKWNIKYIARSGCCNALFELDPEIGRLYEKGESPAIEPRHLKIMGRTSSNGTCPNCGARVERDHSFCPYCGNRL